MNLPALVDGAQTLHIFRGSKDGGTWKDQWEREDVMSELFSGNRLITLNHIESMNWIRIMVKHAQGMFWSVQSVSF